MRVATAPLRAKNFIAATRLAYGERCGRNDVLITAAVIPGKKLPAVTKNGGTHVPVRCRRSARSGGGNCELISCFDGVEHAAPSAEEIIWPAQFPTMPVNVIRAPAAFLFKYGEGRKTPLPNRR